MVTFEDYKNIATWKVIIILSFRVCVCVCVVDFFFFFGRTVLETKASADSLLNVKNL